MYKVLFIIVFVLVSLGFLIYALQVKMIFVPQKLSPHYRFNFSHPFQEHWIHLDGAKINALHFEQKNHTAKGLVIYFHGNAGSLEGWGDVSHDFLPMQYDSFIIDYRGYGKSTGNISSESQLFSDAEMIYQYIQKNFGDRYQGQFVLYGRSIGTGVASWLARKINPHMLILETPYIDLPSLVQEIYPFIPKFMVRFTLSNDQHLQNTRYPVHIFHGTADALIPYQHGVYLSTLSDHIELHTIVGGTHNDLPTHQNYHEILKQILR